MQVQIKDPNFHTISRQVTLDHSVWLAGELTEVAMGLAGRVWDFTKPVRLLSLTAEQLIPTGEDSEQLCLFGTDAQAQRGRRGKLEDAMTEIRSRFGKDSIQLAGFLDNDLGLGGSGNSLEPDESP